MVYTIIHNDVNVLIHIVSVIHNYVHQTDSYCKLNYFGDDSMFAMFETKFTSPLALT